MSAPAETIAAQGATLRGVLGLDLAPARLDGPALLADARCVGTRRGAHDLIIAATAAARRRQVVTLDCRGFVGLPGVSVPGSGD